MDTTKNSREDAARRPRQETSRNSRPQDDTREPRRQPDRQKAPPQQARKQPQQRPNQERQRPAPSREEPQRQTRKAPASREEAPRRKPEGSASQKVPRQQRAEPVQRQKTPQKQVKPGKAPGKRPVPARRREPVDDLSSKKRAYGNSKPKKKSSLTIMGEALVATAREGAAKRRARQEAQGKRSKRPQQPAPAVIYTQPQVFNRNRLLIQLITVTAVVVACVVGVSVFFKVGKITVSGADVYTDWTVKEASGISEGDNLMTFSRARAGALIKANLPYVKNVSFGIKLPDTVNIIIEEEDVVYAIKDQDGQWWLMNSDGHVVEQGNDRVASNYTQILGVAIDHPLANQTAVAVESTIIAPDPTEEPAAETEVTVTPPVTVTGAQRLDTALKILKALEDNDIVGSAASINVAQTQSITLWYGTRYQVNLGDTANLENKIAIMNDVILQMSDYQSGILDISFTIWPDQVGYTPFA